MNTALQSDLQRRVKRMRKLPSSPAVLEPLLKLLRKPSDQIELREVVELVSYDNSIAAQCMRIANSPLFGRSRAADSIQAAVLSLGIRRIEVILLSCCLQQLVPPDKWVADPAVFWRHALGCAMVSREFAERIEYPDPERAYLAGLLHDLGILVNSFAYAEEYREVLNQAIRSGKPLHEVEQSVMGFAHCESGKILAAAWQIPPSVVEVIEWHHDIEHAREENPLIALVHLSDLLCRFCGMGYGYDEWQAVEFAASPAWAILARHCPLLASMDLVRFTLDMEGSVEKISEVVDTVFASKTRTV